MEYWGSLGSVREGVALLNFPGRRVLNGLREQLWKLLWNVGSVDAALNGPVNVCFHVNLFAHLGGECGI